MTLSMRSTFAALLVISSGAAADNLGDARNILCTVLETQVCLESEGCIELLPEDLNIPRFIRVDTRTRKMSTTVASGENRETIASTGSRSEGQVILQGDEAGRAFSLFIDETSGDATFASAADGRSVTVFAACTPETDA